MKPHTLSPPSSVFLIIDPQEKLLPKIFEEDRVTGNIILLIRFARIAAVPCIVTTQYAKGIGPVVDRINKEIPGQSCIDKVEFSCFNNAEFRRHVGEMDTSRNTLILAGIESHICVAQTALGAIEQGYNVHIASDAISSRTERNWQIGLERMREAGAIMSSTEMVIYELLKRSDSPEFKAILPDLRQPVT